MVLLHDLLYCDIAWKGKIKMSRNSEEQGSMKLHNTIKEDFSEKVAFRSTMEMRRNNLIKELENSVSGRGKRVVNIKALRHQVSKLCFRSCKVGHVTR